MYDLVISGGTVVDGTGSASYPADVAVQDGKIVEIGQIDAAAARERIDADGALVAPGWVDIHTHYDGQVTWDDALEPSASNGVTTLVMGNCGVGFAPVRPSDHAALIDLMEGVEDIPGSALSAGMPRRVPRLCNGRVRRQQRAHQGEVSSRRPSPARTHGEPDSPLGR
jgi:N-acyl-D-aspartate/D-glutamate deacylase